jgi:ABC-2 type transport system permease protein
MSAVTSPIHSSKTARTRANSPRTAVPMTTLVNVELRKMTDTRAGKWLLIGVGAVTVLVLALVATTGDPGDRSFTNLLAVAQLPLSVLLPVLGVLAATSEWSQRTVLTTFSLVPSRSRVLSAKLLSSMVLALAAVAFTVVVAAVFAVIAPLAGDAQSNWSVGFANFGEIVIYQQLSMLMGVALGTLLLNSPLAIVLYFVLPTVWSGITDAFDWLADAQLWLDQGTSWIRLIDPEQVMTGQNWAQTAATAALWIVLPLSIGLVRVMRREVD